MRPDFFYVILSIIKKQLLDRVLNFYSILMEGVGTELHTPRPSRGAEVGKQIRVRNITNMPKVTLLVSYCAVPSQYTLLL